MPFFLGNAYQWGNGMGMTGAFVWPWFIVPIALWSACATGVALWHAAKRNEIGWFIFFLFVHTAGILEALYLLFVVGILSSTKEGRAAQKVKSKRRKK